MKHMFTLTGKVVHVFETPKGVNRQSGEEYGGEDKVQIMGHLSLPNGETRMELVSLKTQQAQELQKALNRTVTAPVGVYAYKGAVGYFIPKGAHIDIQAQS